MLYLFFKLNTSILVIYLYILDMIDVSLVRYFYKVPTTRTQHNLKNQSPGFLLSWA